MQFAGRIGWDWISRDRTALLRQGSAGDRDPLHVHLGADLTLGLGKVVHDYLRQPTREALRIREKSLAT